MSLLKLRSRHRAIKSLNGVLSALQMVTTVRLQRIKARYAIAQQYLTPAIPALAGRIPDLHLKKKILVVVSSNRGLCGTFNKAVAAEAAKFARQNPGTALAAMGRRGADILRRIPEFSKRIVFSDTESVEKLDFNRIQAVFSQLIDLESEIYVAYNTYKSTAVQFPKVYKIYPIPEELDIKREPANFILEPNPKELINNLFAHYLKTRFFQIILDSQMGELSARLMVLKGAVDNSKDLITDLQILINKARQATITRELMEIISSAEALRRQHA
jgi:F-type H+-transporting ATPase subunit gamma